VRDATSAAERPCIEWRSGRWLLIETMSKSRDRTFVGHRFQSGAVARDHRLSPACGTEAGWVHRVEPERRLKQEVRPRSAYRLPRTKMSELY
jgi:hypothetical protein